MYRRVLILLLGTATAAASATAPRFDGGAQLRPLDTASADGRFAIKADLQQSVASSPNGRFTLTAALRPDGRSPAVACGTDVIFTNGFDS